MEFCKICPKCNKTYTNGAIGVCGKCKIILLPIHHSYTNIDNLNKVVKIIYKFGEGSESTHKTGMKE